VTFRRRSIVIPTTLAFGFAFLYVPILSMMFFSFNNSKLVTVWDAANSPTLRWYAELFHNQQILDAAWLSIRIALVNATAASLLGMLVGLVLSRFGSFRGRTLLTVIATAPLVMPEVITGLSLLLLFVALEQAVGWPSGRGVATITIAHITFSLAYVAVIVQSRLATFDGSLEEAAMDLGARPLRVFLSITFPLIFPAVFSGWLLSFTLSWDDLVISQFVSGPGATTLPMLIFSKVRLGVSPDVNALATIMVITVAICVVSSAVFLRGRERRRGMEVQMATASDD
jgi:putrescine transport system permease protein